ncbi:Protein N-acetyltransferase, RimJ/RimL family [Sinosporangium album]|uniref:Protein N-acetyltransferase, RimJ/RimL family n=1 Tax=Sinosporangium album TaxID=504805 RepID=A0A1G7ZCZ1_9ACTN|nr:hypothetical protein [Sinosporangium album]SDH06406.1 Protein N-acetyltransferase, RimJ/RimL family [Sinosporangium album]
MIFPYTETHKAALRLSHSMDGPAVHEFLQKEEMSGLDSLDVFTSTWPRSRDEVAAQFSVEELGTGRLAGFTSLHRLSPHSRYVQGCLALPGGDAVAAEAAALTVNYAFAMWNIRKVHFWTVAEGLPGLAATPVTVLCEATLPEYVYDRGTLLDINIFAVYRDEWERHGVPYVTALLQESA